MYPSVAYSNCLYCESDSYDGGQAFLRNGEVCTNSCQYLSNQTISLNNSYTNLQYTFICEDGDTDFATNCPSFRVLNSSSFLCSTSTSCQTPYPMETAVNGTYLLCASVCPINVTVSGTLFNFPYINSAGSTACSQACSTNFYVQLDNARLCVSQCPVPLGAPPDSNECNTCDSA